MENLGASDGAGHRRWIGQQFLQGWLMVEQGQWERDSADAPGREVNWL